MWKAGSGEVGADIRLEVLNSEVYLFLRRHVVSPEGTEDSVEERDVEADSAESAEEKSLEENR